MGTLLYFQHFIFILAQDTTSAIDTTGLGYQVGQYIGSSLPFIGLLLIFLLIIRKSYRFKSKK